MDIVAPEIEQYIATLHPAGDAVQQRMERIAAERSFPIVGPHVGRLLGLLARAVGARRVLELGSGFGYSALWFSRALPENGEVHCTESSAANRDLALELLEQAGVAGRVRFHLGDARELLEQIDGPFDVVFNDIDKEQYPEVIEPVVSRLRPGGLFLTDNVLWKGRVAQDAPDATTRAVLEFNRRVHQHPLLNTTILPIRDGVALCYKLPG